MLRKIILERKGAILAALACLILGTVGGCGSSGDGNGTESAEDPARALAGWYRSVEAEVAKMERKQRGFTRFHVAAEPPSRADLGKLSAAGVRVGEAAESSAARLSQVTTLTKEEAEGLYCYFFAFYVDLEFFPDRASFEEVIFNLVKAERLSPKSTAGIHESADGLRKAMIEAEKATGPAPKVAAGILC